MSNKIFIHKFNINGIIAVVLSSIAICIASLYFSFGNLQKGVFWGYFSHPMIFLLNLLPIIALELIVLAIGRRAYISHAVIGTIILLASAGDYYKILLRNDPFMPSDVPLIFTALNFSSHYDLRISKRIIFAALVLIVGTVVLYFLSKKDTSKHIRITSLCLALLLGVASWVLSNNYYIYTYICDNNAFIQKFTDSETYMSKGFVYPFIHSINKSIDEKPDGYKESYARNVFSTYKDELIAEDKKPNIIVLQLEAFSDMERCGVEGIDDSVYSYYRQLQNESYCGSLSTNIFAGGTVDTERTFLTGCSNFTNYRGKTNSFVWYLKSQGYMVNGSHTCYERFYNRTNVNEYLGFDRYYFMENHYSEIVGYSLYCDAVFFPEINKLLNEDLKSGKPVFSFNVTYQGHGPYPDDIYMYDQSYYYGDKLSEENERIFSNYLGTVKDTMDNLSILITELRNSKEPIVLVVFGDHKPWLGNESVVYDQLGIDLSCASKESYQNYYGTDYLIWANDSAKAMCGNNFVGEGPTISVNYLMTEVFKQMGWRGNTLNQYQSSIVSVLPVINIKGYYYNENGDMVRELDNNQTNIYNHLKMIEYYYRHNFIYKDLGD